MAAPKWVEVEGIVMSRKQWSRKLGGNGGVVSSRIRSGWDPVKAATTPLRSSGLVGKTAATRRYILIGGRFVYKGALGKQDKPRS